MNKKQPLKSLIAVSALACAAINAHTADFPFRQSLNETDHLK